MKAVFQTSRTKCRKFGLLWLPKNSKSCQNGQFVDLLLLPFPTKKQGFIVPREKQRCMENGLCNICKLCTCLMCLCLLLI